MDMQYLRQKEIDDLNAKKFREEKTKQLYEIKKDVQVQMQDRETLREQAQTEYVREREQVDTIINKMIQEDHEMMRINKMKQEQSKQDMILSVNEKNALLKRQRELEEYEDELVKKFYGEQQQRSDEL